LERDRFRQTFAYSLLETNVISDIPRYFSSSQKETVARNHAIDFFTLSEEE
jgi:hypothetical protein